MTLKEAEKLVRERAAAHEAARREMEFHRLRNRPTDPEEARLSAEEYHLSQAKMDRAWHLLLEAQRAYVFAEREGAETATSDGNISTGDGPETGC